MSNQNSSAAARRDPRPSIAEALALVPGFTDLSEGRHRMLASSLQSLLRLEAQPAEVARLDPHRSVALMEAATPATLGIAAGTLANRRVGVRYLLRRFGLLAPRRVRTGPVDDPAWAALLDRLPAGMEFGRLRAFAAACATQDIAPPQVGAATLDAYAERRAASHGGAKSRDHARRVANQWNQAAREIPAWPQVRLGLTAMPLQRTLPFDAFPETLQAEAAAYLAAIGQQEDDIFTGSGRRAVSTATVRTRHYGLRGLLWGAVQSGTPPEAITTLRMVATPAVATSSLRWHLRRKDGKVTADLAQLAATVASIAYYLELPPAEMTPLKAVLARVRQPPRTEITDRNTRILAALDDPATRACLLHLPRHLMGMAARQRDGWTDPKTGLHHSPRPVDAAWLASVAVAIEILLHAPMRIKNLQHLQIGQGLRLASTGRGRWSGTILVAGVTTKNGIGLEVPLEAETITLLREYLEEHRGALPHADTAWLFPGEASPDRPRNKGAFGLAITEGIHAIVGLRINPHAFRAIAGSFILEANPHAIDDVRAMLGQSTFHTALIYYRRRNQHAAAGRLSETLARQRRSTRLLASARMLAPDLMRGMRRGVR